MNTNELSISPIKPSSNEQFAVLDVAYFFAMHLNALVQKYGYLPEDRAKFLSWHQPKDFLEKITDDSRFFRVIRDLDGKIIAYFESKQHAEYSDTQTIQWMFVDEKYRNQGLMRKLFDEFEAWCKEKGYTTVKSLVHVGNETSQLVHNALMGNPQVKQDGDDFIYTSSLKK